MFWLVFEILGFHKTKKIWFILGDERRVNFWKKSCYGQGPVMEKSGKLHGNI